MERYFHHFSVHTKRGRIQSSNNDNDNKQKKNEKTKKKGKNRV